MIPQTSTSSNLNQIHTKLGLLNYAVISDIHLGHNKNPAWRIVDNLFKAFPDNATTAALDIIFIAGDAFDDVLMFNDEDIDAIVHWSNSLLRLCKKHNIKLRILEGTPGHDRNQSAFFVMENNYNEIGCDLVYHDRLAIEYFEDLDIHVLYVPDELAGGHENTLRDVKDLMRAKGLTKVDHAIMHGLFDFQVPDHFGIKTHNSAEYLELVSGHVWIGHDHTFKELDRIHGQGSFDRIAHGYEAPKGHMRALQQADGDWSIQFVENVDAMIFKTITCTGMDLTQTLDYIRHQLAGIPDGSHIRIRADSNNPIFTSMDSLVRLAPLMSWAKDPQRDKDKALAPLAEVGVKFVPISITRDNISELILERIANEGASGEVIDSAIEILEEMFPCKMKPTMPTVLTAGR